MPDAAASGLPRDTRWASGGLGIYAVIGGLTSFIGWAADLRLLTDWDDVGISIQPNTTLAAMLAGAALVLLAGSRPRAAAAAGVGAGLLGGTAIFQYLSGVDLGIDTLLLFGRPWGRLGTLVPGRMGPPAALSFTLLGIGLVLAAYGPRTRRLAPAFGVLVVGIAMLSVIGYPLGARLLYSVPWLTTIALQTSTILLAVGLGLVLAVPEHEPTRTLRESGAAGVLVRGALPIIVVVPIVLAFLRVRGEAAGLYDAGMGGALQTLVLIVLLVGLLWWNAGAIRKHERAEREAAERLREADRRKDEFLATLAHELRGPLAPLRNSLEIMKRAHGDPPLVDQARSTMERQVGQMVRLIDDLLDVSRVTHNRLELKKETVELGSIIHHAVESSRPLADRAGHELNVALPPEPLYLSADAVRLAQVFGNLLANACKYTEHQGRIDLTAERQGSEVVVRVKDNGVGIPPDMLPRVFDLFTQVNRTIERSQGGLGIGLALVKQVVELHEGVVTAHSEGLGRGSQFIVRLPILLQAPHLAPAPIPAPIPTPARRILVVDDNRDSAESLVMLLELTGHHTQAAHDGVEAVGKASAYRPDVILLDIGLPEMSGYDACRAIREQPWGSDIVIVALTGWGQDEDRRRSQEAGFDGHLVKPVDPSALMKLLASFE